jgi:hypothetical protein
VQPPVTAAEPGGAAVGFEGPVAVTVDGVPLSEPGVLPPGADIQPAAALAEPEPPATEAVAAQAPQPAPAPATGMTIEDYLMGLLSYDPEAPKTEAPATPSPAAEPAEGAEGEDLEQFQEWLRGLKS